MNKIVKVQAVLLSAVIMLTGTVGLQAGPKIKVKRPAGNARLGKGWSRAAQTRLNIALERAEKAAQRQESGSVARGSISQSGTLGRAFGSTHRIHVGESGARMKEGVSNPAPNEPNLMDIMTSPTLPPPWEVSPRSLLREGEPATPENMEAAMDRYITIVALDDMFMHTRMDIMLDRNLLNAVKKDKQLVIKLSRLMRKRVWRAEDKVARREARVVRLERWLQEGSGEQLPLVIQTGMRLLARHMLSKAQYTYFKRKIILEEIQKP